ncbi:MAG TPA: Mpo1-like protein [Noviherbaspirillum sp.]|uniref:Mpo1 family 2-hydroxy fatty acid dioxygenase n=1 Tax=Noviherbaspirillum sp. TaxID=1926288 RepID=UPI002F95E961
MKTLEDQLSQYAAYHRDARNIRTHFIGIPLIVVAVTILLSRPATEVGGFPVSPALAAALAAGLYYLMLDFGLGLLMAVLLAFAVWIGAWTASLSTGTWLAAGLGGFVVGWIFQFVGHAWEGRKPAFVDDLAGLIIGPLFVVAEALFMVGLLPALRARIEDRAGPFRHGAAAQADAG